MSTSLEPEIDLTSALSCWSLSPQAKASLINVSENRTYLITDCDGSKTILREHRPDYHSLAAIESELNWLQALQTDENVKVPVVILGQNNYAIQTVTCLDNKSDRHLVMFEYIEGSEPVDDENLLENFETLGSIAARMHNHTTRWNKPKHFNRRDWNIDTVLGSQAAWGHWRDGPGVDKSVEAILMSLETALRKRLSKLGMSVDVYGLIHADMRRANLLLNGDVTYVIDFDDCGFGWFLYDFATAVSFIEDHPQMDEMKTHWLTGYRRHRSLSAEHAKELQTFVLFRRLALLGWMGTHADVEIVRNLSATYANGSVVLAERYLM